jgi:hypothetical protein
LPAVGRPERNLFLTKAGPIKAGFFIDKKPGGDLEDRRPCFGGGDGYAGTGAGVGDGVVTFALRVPGAFTILKGSLLTFDT